MTSLPLLQLSPKYPGLQKHCLLGNVVALMSMQEPCLLQSLSSTHSSGKQLQNIDETKSNQLLGNSLKIIYLCFGRNLQNRADRTHTHQWYHYKYHVRNMSCCCKPHLLSCSHLKNKKFILKSHRYFHLKT